MKKLVIGTLALGAMTSVAFADEPLKATSGQPMQLSLTQMDDVTAGRFYRINVDVAIVKDNRQSNRARQQANVHAWKIEAEGRCGSCTVLVGGSNVLDQSNEIEVEF